VFSFTVNSSFTGDSFASWHQDSFERVELITSLIAKIEELLTQKLMLEIPAQVYCNREQLGGELSPFPKSVLLFEYSNKGLLAPDPEHLSDCQENDRCTVLQVVAIGSRVRSMQGHRLHEVGPSTLRPCYSPLLPLARLGRDSFDKLNLIAISMY
jgi:hypothetical protein